MKAVAIIIFVVLAMFVTWLVYDTIKLFIKKFSDKKKNDNKKKQQEENKDDTTKVD